jgi:DNA-binding CsgD family transcriptional regulator
MRRVVPIRRELSPRELEVARLIAHGRTNRQIAAATGISERTVDTHVGRILRKLGVVNRAQIASWITLRMGGALLNAR